MYERFTQEVNNALDLAHHETKSLGHREMGTTQLLLGLIRQEKGLAAQLLRDAGVTLENARLEVEKIQGRGGGSRKDIPYNQHTWEVFDFSAAEADKLNDSEIDTQHLLLGLLRQTQGWAVRVLQILGIEPNELRTQVLRKLAEQGHPTASQFLPSPTTTNSNGTNSNKVHLALIQKILENPQGSEAEVVRNNPDLIDPELIERVASILEQQKNSQGAELLRGLITPRHQQKTEATANLTENSVTVSQPIEISSFLEVSVPVPKPVQLPDPPKNIEPIIQIPAPTNQEMEKFIFQLVRVTFESKGNEEIVHNFFRDNLDQLNDRFPDVLRNWWLSKVPNFDPNQKLKLAKRILAISSLIRKFEGGSRANNLEIALTGYHIIAPVFTEAEYPEQSAIIQNCLGLTYLERVQGNWEENLKLAIAYFTVALSFYKKDQFPKERKVILNNLKKAANEISNQLKQQEQNNHNQIAKNESFDLQLDETTGVTPINGLRPNEQDFVVNLLNILLQYQRDPQIIYPILQDNLDKLTVGFAERLRAWGVYQIRQFLPEDSQTTAGLLSWFGDLMLSFPLGDKTANIAIARAGYECGLTFYTREKNPFIWAEIMKNLGIAYEEDPEADPTQKWEEAIACYESASQVFTREVNPEKWASIQDNLGNAYRNRLLGETEINLQQAIQYHQNALEVFTPEINPTFSGISQHNLGSDYLALSVLNIANNEQSLESSIEHYEQALKILKKEIYPDLWAMNQLSLGKAYSVRLRGNPEQNHEKAQQYYENALSVYTPQTYPFYYQQAKEGQQRLQKLIQVISESESNQEDQEDFSFISEALNIILASQGDVQKLFAFLEKNLDKLNQDLPRKIIAFISDLMQTKSKEMPVYMEAIAQFSTLMYIFPGGNREINLNIAIKGWHLISSLPGQSSDLSSEVSHLFAMMKLYLGSAFYEKHEQRWGEREVNLEEAIKYFEEGFTVLKYENNLDRDLWASCQNKLGVCYLERYEIKGDNQDIKKAIDAYESALKVYPENTLDWAMVQMNLGNSYCVRQGDLFENLTHAIKCYEKSLTVRKHETYPTEWADVQLNLGQAYYRRGMLGHSNCAEDIELAIQSYNNALEVYNNSSTIRWAQLKNGLGVCYSDRRIGNYPDNLESAINYLNEALTVITPQTDPYEWARILNNLGVIYRQRKQGGRGDRITNLRSAIDCYEQALQVFKPEKYPVDWAQTQGNLATTYRVLAENIDTKENLKKAIACVSNAERIFRKNPQQWAKIQFELGTCYKNLGEFANEKPAENLAKAIECYQNALRFTSRESHPFGWAEITNSLGNAYQHNGQYQEAIKYFEDTLKLHTREAFPTDYIKTKVNLANAHVKNNKLKQAFNSYEEAINTLEDLLSQLGTDDDAKRKLGEEWVRAYQYMIAVCLKLGKQNPEYYATAWEYAERSKSRRLVELFGQTKPDGVSDEIWKEFQDLRNQVTHEQKWIEDQENLIKKQTEKLIILSEQALLQHPELDSKKANLTNLKQQLNQKLNDYPRLAATQRVQYTPFSKIGEKLSDDHTVIIQWYLLEADQKFCAFIYTRQIFQPYVWESSPQDFENLQEWYQEYFVNYISDFNEWSNKLSDRLNRLAKILHIDELLNHLPAKCQQVILIPHRYLHLLPIHALPIKPETWQKFNPNSTPNQENYLFECFTKGVRYAPSCQTLLMLEKRSRPNFNQLFAMGNPTQDRAFTELCVKTVETFWKQKKPQSETKVLCGEQATKDALIHELKDYLKNAHTFLYSGHGSFEFDSPLDSGLILHEKKRLQLTEIFGLNLEQCRLVTLIGCETGMTDWTSITDEYVGLPSAFLWAGVSGIVSSLWTVEEKPSVFLGIKLYQNLLAQPEGEKNVIQALREAQNWLRNVTGSDLNRWMLQNKLNQLRQMLNNNPPPNNDKPFSSPYYWAAFCVIGK